ncbi:hypothetical protein F2Q70_00017399 [Brassica cretica]|uniref:Uncharacterized protein n=1 Tax=Brassica cretica TaxID=69181 RepID=A0A8S9KYP3_BRACR|nr:hypothetical protein F2Q70_00017399 [Brassica cretica]KAF2600890.1 hypothetical protein F2Q68_00010365 [Brassica cretica]
MERRPSLRPPVPRYDDLEVCSVIAIRPWSLPSKLSERATRSYPERSRAPKATRWSTKSSNRAAQSARRGCGESRALLISPEVKEKLDENFKQLEQSAEKLSQLESENLTLQDKNQALNTASNKKHRFRTQIRSMPTLEKPNSRTDANLPPTTSQGDAAMREKTKGARIYDVEDSESKPEPDKEASEGVEKTESPMAAYLEKMFSKRLDAMQSLVERLPRGAPPSGKAALTPTPTLLSRMRSP